jgi:Predicted GTPase
MTSTTSCRPKHRVCHVFVSSLFLDSTTVKRNGHPFVFLSASSSDPSYHHDDDDDDAIQPQEQEQQQQQQQEEEENVENVVVDDDGDDANDNVIYYSPNTCLNHDEETPSSNNRDESITTSSHNEYSFFDEAVIYVRAGSGGQGSSTYQKGPGGQNGLPDGGDGGKGGDVILVVDDSLNTLAGLTRAWRPNAFGGGGGARVLSSSSSSGGGGSGMVRPLSFRAENGEDGKRGFKNGKFGKDFVVRVPPGTVVQEEVVVVEEEGNERREKEQIANTNLVDLGILGKEEWERKLVVARGGTGGDGSGNQGYKKGRGVRRTRAPPEGGERKRLRLTLKIVADVALVGVPNAGKSTFLASVTRAKPKIANYPFTTVIPNLGVWVPPNEYNDKSEQGSSASEGLAICDVPGLIEGAAEGAGLGHAFLRHVERCHIILHLVDATSNDPIADYLMVNKEIMRYGNGKLAQMPQIIVVNKIDAWEEGSGEEWEIGLKTRMNKETLEASLKEVMPHSRLMWMSAKEKDGVDELMRRMSSFVKKVKAASNQ